MPASGPEWLKQSYRRLRSDGAWGAANSLYDLYLAGFLSVTSRRPVGANLLDRDWDALIILDACRVDALREVSDEYDFIEEVNTMWSVGSHSFEWLQKTFTEDRRETIADLAYVTGNPFVAPEFFEDRRLPRERMMPFDFAAYDPVPLDAFGYLDSINGYEVDEELGVVAPETITDRAIRAGRERDESRLMVHYMQPHDPFILDDGGTMDQVFNRLRRDELTVSEAWPGYLQTLRTVLDEVSVLLENLDADRVVITADHGDAFGELGFYGHVPGFPHPAVKRVPYVETTATDTGTYEPSIERTERDESNVEAHLEALGYR